MASPADIKAAQEKVGEAVLSSVRSPNAPSSGEEPIAGKQGRGTADQPYDQGNQPEQPVSGTEPPSGQQGLGTAEEPFDAGNKQEQSGGMSIVDQLSRTRTKDEIKQQKERKLSRAAPNQADPSTNIYAQTQTPSQPQTQPQPTPTITTTEAEPARGRANTSERSGPPSMKDAPPAKFKAERSVSPGQLDDGSHVKTSGLKGEGYAPPSGLGRLKGKLHGIGH